MIPAFGCKPCATAVRRSLHAWHWFNLETKAVDERRDTPMPVGFFQPTCGVITRCHWNRLAYKAIDSRGPHADWDIGDWRTNPKTGACRTLNAMALRILCRTPNPLKGSVGRMIFYKRDPTIFFLGARTSASIRSPVSFSHAHA